MQTAQGRLHLLVAIDRVTKSAFVELHEKASQRIAGGFLRAHAFKYACAQNDIDHRLTEPRQPWIKGQVERVNRTLKGPTPNETICRIWTSEPKRFTLNPLHQMPGPNIQPSTWRSKSPG